MKKFLNCLPKRFQWTIHNLISHPVSEIFHLLGLEKLSIKIHDCTIPDYSLEGERE